MPNTAPDRIESRQVQVSANMYVLKCAAYQHESSLCSKSNIGLCSERIHVNSRFFLSMHDLTLMACSLARCEAGLHAADDAGARCCEYSTSRFRTWNAPPTVRAADAAAQTYTAPHSPLSIAWTCPTRALRHNICQVEHLVFLVCIPDSSIRTYA